TGDQRRTGMVLTQPAAIVHQRAMRRCVFLTPDQLLRWRQTAPAVVLRPRNARPAAVVLRALPRAVIGHLAGEVVAFRPTILRLVGVQPFAHLGAKLALVSGLTKLHALVHSQRIAVQTVTEQFRRMICIAALAHLELLAEHAAVP